MKTTCQRCEDRGTIIKDGPHEDEYDSRYPCPDCSSSIKLSVHIAHPRQGKILPKEIMPQAWGFDGLSVPEALRRVANSLEVPAIIDEEGKILTPARGRADSVVVWINRTDNRTS